MSKFEIFVDELVKHQHRVVVEAESEDKVEGALEYADKYRENTANDYIYRLRDKLEVLEHDDDYSVESKEVECYDFIEISIEEDESEEK